MPSTAVSERSMR